MGKSTSSGPSTAPAPWITVAEASRTFGVHRTTLHRWIAKGVVDAKRLHRGGRTAAWLVDPDQVAAKADELDRLSAYMYRKPPSP